jgi:predicted transposase YdaD
MQEEQPLTEEMVQQILEMRSKARHEEASRLFQAEQRGKEQSRISIAKNMLKFNIPIDTISQATGLTASEIENLK